MLFIYVYNIYRERFKLEKIIDLNFFTSDRNIQKGKDSMRLLIN